MRRSPANLEAVEKENNAKWKFSELLEDPNLLERWEKVRKYFFLRESTYDMTNRCNIKCDGCYYYSGGKQFAQENRDPMSWRDLMKAEKTRGITYVVLAGAEPALVPEILQACFEEMPLGSIASNGLKRIPESVGYRIHVSIWGNDETSRRVRNVKNLMLRQIENYQGDPRATFVYTFCRTNIPETYEVVKELAKNNCKVTFNVFSAPVGYSGELRHTPETRAQTRRAMVDLLQEYPDHVLFSPYSAIAHTSSLGLHKLYKCSYPRMNPSVAGGLGRSFRQYRADLTWDRSASCCVPDTDCDDCRHYASGSAVVTARLYRHTGHPDIFKSWLDYVDTYLAVWVMGYDKGKNLCNHFEPAPGFSLD